MLKLKKNIEIKKFELKKSDFFKIYKCHFSNFKNKIIQNNKKTLTVDCGQRNEQNQARQDANGIHGTEDGWVRRAQCARRRSAMVTVRVKAYALSNQAR